MKNQDAKLSACETSGCGFKCCNYGKDGHIVILPNELETADGSISHLEILDDDYLGGKKVACRAKDTATCDGGYKPIQCGTYPIWVKSEDSKKIFKSQKCPLSAYTLSKHQSVALGIIESYKRKNPNTVIEQFLANAEVDRYEEMEYGRYLTKNDYAEVYRLERSYKDGEEVIRSTSEEVMKSVDSGMSYGIFDKMGRLIAYSLCYGGAYGYACYLEKSFTVEARRGKGLHIRTLHAVKEKATEFGYAIMIATVSDKNERSLKNFIGSGFEHKKTMANAFGTNYTRFILVCEL